MACPPHTHPAADAGPVNPFARLVQELLDLDFIRVDPFTPDVVSYTMPTASELLATIERSSATGLARFAALSGDGCRKWEVTCTAATPPHVQILLLYTVLLAGEDSEQDLLRSVADALRVDLDAEAADQAGTPAG